MSLENKEEGKMEIIHVSKIRLDIRYWLLAIASIIFLAILVWRGYLDVWSLRLILAAFIGSTIGLVVGYFKAPPPDYYIELDTSKLYNRIDIRLIPKHLRKPREPSIATSSEGGSSVYIITKEELAELGLSELNIRREELKSLASRALKLEQEIARRLGDIELEASKKARELFMRYLRLRKKLQEEMLKKPKETLEEE